MGETLGREIAAHFSLAVAEGEGGTERGQGRRSPAHSLRRGVLSTDTFLWRRASLAVGSFHGDLIRPLLLVTRTRRQAEQSEQTEMDLIIRGRPRE